MATDGEWFLILRGMSKLAGNSGKVKKFLVHRLVAQAFIPNNEKKEIVKHRDGDNENNDVSNLYWQSYEELREINGHGAPTIRSYTIEQ